MVHVHHQSTIAVSREFAFDYVADMAGNGPAWVFGVTGLEVEGGVEHGLGTVYNGSLQLGPTVLHSHVEVVRWEPPSVVGTKSVKGFVNTSTWTFIEAGEEVTELVVDIVYDLPGGVAGRVLGRVIEPFVGIAVRHSDKELRNLLVKRYEHTKDALR
jgi:hypothetical protein